MKVCVIAPSEEYLKLAGVRIRYLRIEAHLRALGCELSVEVIDRFQSLAQFKHDVYLFSKCYDARCFLIARLLMQTNKRVGIDLFDDYFSQSANSRFIIHREWLRSMAGLIDFFLCSTARMRDVALGYMPGKPGHILNDPFDSIDPQALAATTRSSLERTLSSGRIDIAWFGQGDNPHFAVGLSDLHAFGHSLQELAGGSFTVRLRILTNKRALTADGLEMLTRLPVPWTLDEWSVSRENELLASSLLAFIPVNAQPFSMAKSLNRAVSALSGGAQVLSTGYPLYEPLGDFVYRSTGVLLADLARGELRLREQTVPALLQRLGECGDPRREAELFHAFLKVIRRGRPATAAQAGEGSLGLIHGVRSRADLHRFTQRMRQLSIASPYSEPILNYDVRLVIGADGVSVEAQLSDRACGQVRPDLQALLRTGTSVTGKAVKCLEVSEMLPGLASRLSHVGAAGSKIARLAGYPRVMAAVREATQTILPGVEVRYSEAEAPFWASPAAAMAPLMEAADA